MSGDKMIDARLLSDAARGAELLIDAMWHDNAVVDEINENDDDGPDVSDRP